MAKHRKNHKQKLEAFKQRKVDADNRMKKMQKMFIDNYLGQQENARKEYMIETIYTNRNELVKEVDGVWTLNEEVVEEQNGMLVWKSDNNPILAGLEASIEAYSEYTIELVNQLLPQIQNRLKWKAEKEATEAGVQTLPVTKDDLAEAQFELIEDPTFTEGTANE